MAQRKSFAARKRQRMVECFETIDEAKRRVKNAPKQQKRSHIPSTVDGNLEQQMLDVNDWKTVNWSEKAKEYQIRRKGASVPPPNAGQVLKEYLKSWGVNTSTFDQKKSKYFAIMNTSKLNIVHKDLCHFVLLQTLEVYM